jgi:hypothetical protein
MLVYDIREQFYNQGYIHLQFELADRKRGDFSPKNKPYGIP